MNLLDGITSKDSCEMKTYKILTIWTKSKAFFFENLKIGDIVKVEVGESSPKLQVYKNYGEPY